MIFILNKQEKVVNILRNGGGANQAPPFFDDIYSQDLATGAETFSFSTVAINNVTRDLVVGNYVAFKNNEGEYKLFQITQTEEYHEDAMYMNIYAEGAGLELINKVFRARKSPSTSLRKFMEMVLDETGWNVGTIPFAAQESIDLDLEDATVYATLQNTLSKYGVEMSFRCEINNGRISTKYVDLHTQRGRVTGKRFSFGKDIEGIRRKVDSTELFTALIGRGNSDISFKDVTVDGIDKPLGQDFVADQNAYDRYNNNGYHIMGIFNYDTDSPEELLRETYKQLQKCKEPKIEYEVSVALLGELLGESWNKVSIGDTVAIVDNAFNPPIHLMARVSKLDRSFTDNQSDTCTLANFIEVKSNITDEMRKLASQLEGYVEGALDNKFPIGSDDIKEGAVNGSHIYKDTISTDHLIADAVTANKIKAESIETKHLQADIIKSEHISAEQIEAEHIKSGSITADKIEVGTITAESGIIADATIGTAQIKDAEITVAKIQNAFVDSLVANQGKFQSAHIGKLTSDNIDADTIKAEHIQASVIDAINLNVEGKISADRIEAIKMEVEELDAGKITTGTLDSDRITSSVITAINASLENATIDSAKIGELSSDKISANVIDAINMNVEGKINANRIDVDSITVNNIDASKITSGFLSSERIEAESIEAEKLSAQAISTVGLEASKITANDIESGKIKVGNANIVDATISGTKIANATITNAQIEDATIESAKIKEIYASKIKSGTVETGELDISSIDGTLNIKGNTIQIRDNQTTPVTRVQIGKDARNEYGILVLNSEGKAIFDSDKGVLIPQGLADEVVSETKIIDNAITSKKLNVDELFVGDNAFIQKIKAVEIDASNITTGTISGERIDIKGLISFEALDQDLQMMFDVADDKTYINGGMIATNTIKASSIDLLSGLTVRGEDNTTTFSIASNGEVEVNGLLKSGNFDKDKNTGYQLSTDGKAILNQAIVKGDVILPSAGLTNYGAIKGNNNLISGTSDLYQNYSTGQFYQNLSGGTLSLSSLGLKAGDTVTFRVYIKAMADKGARAMISHYYGDGTDYTTAFGNIIKVGDEGYSTITVTLRSDANEKGIFVGIISSDTSTTTSAVGQYKEAKFEKDSSATPWCVHEKEQLNQVRIWAGASYDNRTSAKFRVYDNGDIFATDGTFNGKMYGDLDSGLVHIHNNEIVINSTSTFMDESGIVRSIEPMDHNPNPYLRLGAGTSILNTDLILGSETDRKIEFSNDNRELNFTNTALNLNSPTRTSGANVFFNPKGAYNSTFGIESVVADTDAKLTIGYLDGSWVNTTIITHNGSRGATNGDICFKRSDSTENLNVYIQGDVKVRNSIQSSVQNIEMRSVSNEGWGFYAT